MWSQDCMAPCLSDNEISLRDGSWRDAGQGVMKTFIEVLLDLYGRKRVS